MKTKQHRAPTVRPTRCAAAISLALLSLHGAASAQQADAAAQADGLETIQVSGDWLGTGLENSVKTYPGARTVVKKDAIEQTGATSIGDLLRRVPGVQSTDNSGTAGSAISLNIGVRGLTGRYSPRSTILLDGIPLASAPYGQPQLSFAPVNLNNIESVDVIRGGGSVRFGPQNVGGIINFKSRSIPTTPGVTGDATMRYNSYDHGGSNKQYSAFVGGQAENGLGVALLYSGQEGSGWRDKSNERFNDVALKLRFDLGGGAEIYGKVSYYDVLSHTAGGLTTAQYNANPFQNTRPLDFWKGDRKGFDFGYLNTISDTQEFEIRTYFNQSSRASTLIQTGNTTLRIQPRNYETTGIEPRYTQRFTLGSTTHDVTVGYRYLRERGTDYDFSQTIATGVIVPATAYNNSTDANAGYIDDKIAIGKWRITPGLRFESIRSTRAAVGGASTFEMSNNKPLPSVNVAYLLNNELTLFANYNTSFGVVQNTQLSTTSAANPLAPELAKTAETGARWKSDRLSMEATLFNIRFDNQIEQVSSTPLLYRNLGKTQHNGIELALDYTFDPTGVLRGWSVYANYAYTRALQESGQYSGKDLAFYSRTTDTVGTRYQTGPWGLNISTTHQSRQFADASNVIAENAAGGSGEIPGFRLWNAQVDWKVPGAKGFDVFAGVNNLTDRRYFTRTQDGNVGKLVGAPRTIYVQGRYAF
ncbi:TonB-dependent siderophore receptor [Herbaspirillum sp. LeCh32-8]|uniref:TonB-dependent receptor family protein n=1 Tax=Herbaspirillum sp. LeCh32-8 TaxID=2821356 RepID=UPI001AE22406|nr:TonB-dependent siderophore receptor [Herbaspirillum sp. LeCh32-8]MBP0596758.1 TonB-dependent siderophore receptor [Herbaspirillum sp. LeCh32-8]